MAKFLYEAKSATGASQKGEIEATNETEARVRLRAQRLIPLKVVPSGAGAAGAKKSSSGGGSLFGGSVKPKDLQIMTRQLSTLLNSGVPVLQALETLSEGSRNVALSNALRAVLNDINSGKRLGDSLESHPRIFNKFYVNMVKAGEESGNLDQILQRLAMYIEKSVKLQSKVKGALIYPVAILVVAFSVVAGLLIFVIPKFQSLFENMGSELPALTKIVIDLSNAFVANWYFIIGGIVFGVYGLIQYLKTPSGKMTFDVFMIDVPLFGNLIQKSGVARFSRTLSTLLTSGVSIMEALDISAKTVGNIVLEKSILRARDAITEGKSLTSHFQKEKYMPHMVVQMIGVGEQTGTLDAMLARIADFYEDEVDVAVGALTTIIEPLMMVVLGGLIAFIVIAMYLPIFNMAGAVG